MEDRRLGQSRLDRVADLEMVATLLTRGSGHACRDHYRDGRRGWVELTGPLRPQRSHWAIAAGIHDRKDVSTPSPGETTVMVPTLTRCR